MGQSIPQYYLNIIESKPTIDQAKKYYQEHNIQYVYQENQENVDAKGFFTLFNYSLFFYKVINPAMLYDREESYREHSPFIYILNRAIIDAKQTNIPYIVFRKVFLKQQEIDKLPPKGQLFRIPTFLSCTSNENVAKNWKLENQSPDLKPVLMCIYLVKQQRDGVIVMKNYTAYPEEDEVLLTAFSLFKVEGLPNEDNCYTLSLILQPHTDQQQQKTKNKKQNKTKQKTKNKKQKTKNKTKQNKTKQNKTKTKQKQKQNKTKNNKTKQQKTTKHQTPK